MRKWFEIGGLLAAVVLIAVGGAAVVMAYNGHSTVQNAISQENIVGTPDMTPQAITAEAQKAGLNVNSLTIPSMSVANLPINSGDRAHAFAGYMRIHTLEATQGQTYAQMPRYATADGKGTNDASKALMAGGQPQDNPARNIWITSTALTTALQSSYMASQLATFGFVVGIALLLSGIGFAVLAIGGALRNPETALTFLHKSEQSRGDTAVPAH